MKDEALLEQPRRSRLIPTVDHISDWPWWLFVAIGLALFISFKIVTDPQINVIFSAVASGARLTVTITLYAYALALTIGLFMGLGRVSKNPVIYNIASFYVEIIRGFPMLVLLLYIAFVGVPLLVTGLNTVGNWMLATLNFGTALAELTTRNIDNTTRAIIALGVGYGAFSAEIFRAGIESIERGQMEAARALGMNYPQAMRHVVLPQAVRRVLPALGNDFVAMVKDSALVSVLGVREMTQFAKLYAASTFLFFQTYSILAFLYLVVIIMLTRVVRWMERRLSRDRR